MEHCDVSVVVATYNPEPDKLRRTLKMIALQEDVNFEVIITDDGSAKKDFSFLPEFMADLGITQFRLIEQKENQGTVCNCLSGVEAAQGKYVLLTSPGDYLFDCRVLRDFYCYCEENDISLCFGNAVFYNADNGKTKITRCYGTPAQPQIYAPNASAATIKTAFSGGIWVVGATYFRRRDVALKTLRKIANISKYMEDTTSTICALMEGHHLCYYDRNIVFYEDGTGVSTAASSKWSVILRQDLRNVIRELKQSYPRDPYIDMLYRNLSDVSKVKRMIGKLVVHPILTMRILIFKHLYPKKPIIYSQDDFLRLQTLLDGRTSER